MLERLMWVLRKAMLLPSPRAAAAEAEASAGAPGEVLDSDSSKSLEA